MRFSGISKANIYAVLFLTIHVIFNGHRVSCTSTNVSFVADNWTNTVLPNENTTASPSDGMTTSGKDKRILDLLPGAILNMTVSDGQWHTFTIQFDERLLSSWLACLGSDHTTNCTTQTQHVFGSAYYHRAGATSNLTSATPSKNVFTCVLEDSRYVQETAVISCARSNSSCVNGTGTCSLATDEASAVITWDASQNAAFRYNASFVRRDCGDVCEGESEATNATTQETETKETIPYWIWIIVGIVGGLLLICVIIVVVIMCQKHRLRKKRGSKTLDHKDDQGGDKRSSRFSREEDPSDELRLGDNDIVTSVGFVELSELWKSSDRNIAADVDQPEKMSGDASKGDEGVKEEKETELEGD